ncbi:MAG: hypothetical protein OEW29_09760, partial [Acidimicrobiia bacterium]|nr:hypothetical protein [Acidimicrobiia bacterium]
MTWFTARNISISTVPVRPDAIWRIITDPPTLAALTPMVRSIEASGSTWQWALTSIEALGLKVEAVFTERMEFVDQQQITFTHDPPVGSRERAGVEGVYTLSSTDANATDLRVDLTLSIDLPLPGLSRHAVQRVLLSKIG